MTDWVKIKYAWDYSVVTRIVMIIYNYLTKDRSIVDDIVVELVNELKEHFYLFADCTQTMTSRHAPQTIKLSKLKCVVHRNTGV